MKTKHLLINGDSRKMSLLRDSSVQLVVTSPPYWQLKDYGITSQIGFHDTYEEYINHLNLVWKECYRVLNNGCRLCINIGDQFARSAYYGRYKVVPIHSEIIRFCEAIGFDYMGSIIWQKPTSMHPTGGQKVMGSYPFPRGGILKIDFEHILLFKKLGKSPSVTKEVKESSQLTDKEWETYFSSHWLIPGAKQDKHIAVFPEEIPHRLIRMFSFTNDIILDPFMGSGTTALAACKLNRNSIGYEINKHYKEYYQEKVVTPITTSACEFCFKEDNTLIDLPSLLKELPYQFTDKVQISKQANSKEQSYGSVVEDKHFTQRNTNDVCYTKDYTVLINHVSPIQKKLMIDKGICYLRAGDSKGSLLITPGFERMKYLYLFTPNDRTAELFPLKHTGKFQIWNKETLEEYGFHPRHAKYYVVLLFDNNKPITINKTLKSTEKNITSYATIKPIHEFVSLT